MMMNGMSRNGGRTALFVLVLFALIAVLRENLVGEFPQRVFHANQSVFRIVEHDRRADSLDGDFLAVEAELLGQSHGLASAGFEYLPCSHSRISNSIYYDTYRLNPSQALVVGSSLRSLISFFVLIFTELRRKASGLVSVEPTDAAPDA